MAKPGGIGFCFLNVTQFLGAFNDNIIKQVLMFGLALGGIWAGVLGLGSGAQWVASALFCLPFILFSGFAGQFSDKYSKRQVSIMTKWSEIPIALIAMLGLWLTNLPLVLFALVLIALQSTFFSPAKFGILPEIVPDEKLSRANGTMNMFTWFAIILGCALGGWIYDLYAPSNGEARNLWLPGLVILLVGISGTISSHGISAVPRQNPKRKISYRIFDEYYKTWCKFRGKTAMTVVFAYAFFYMIIAGVAALILPDYKAILSIDATTSSILLVILSVFLGFGDYAAGLVSTGRIRPELLNFGSIGTAVAFLALGLIPHSFYSNPAAFYVVALFLGLGGFMAGFVMVPLQTMVQYLAGDEQRGRFIGFWNCASFSGMLIGSLVFGGIVPLQTTLGVSGTVAATNVWFLCAILTLIFQLFYFFLWRKPFAEAVKQVEV